MKAGKTIYLDHQATTPVDPSVLSEMIPYFSQSFGNPHSSDHSLGWESAQAIERSAAQVGRLVGADPDEVIFTSGATEANNLALLGLGRRMAQGRRCRILMSAIEHRCVLAAGRVLRENYGFEVQELPVNREGFLDLSALEEALDEDVLLVSVMFVNNEIGTIQDMQEVSELTQKHGALLHCDAAQAPVAKDISSIARVVDVLTLTAHKMYGPKGIGAMYISRALKSRIEPLIYGGGQQGGLRGGTLPVPLCVGMGAAAELMYQEETKERRAQLRQRRDTFVKRLSRLSWPIAVNGPSGVRSRHPGNASIRFIGFSGHEILGALQPHLAASTGSACSSGLPEPSHVLRAIGLDSEGAESCIRFSLGFGTSDEDVDSAVDVIEEVLERLPQAEPAY